jgi:hypothetical protein
MQLKRAPLQVARDAAAIPAEPGRTSAVLTLAGCAITLLAAILPWSEKATFGFSLTTAHGADARILLAALAVASATLAGTVLLRGQSTAGVAILLVALAVAQIGAGIWFGVTVINEVRGANPHLVLISAIGTGTYMAGLGSVSTLIGAVLAWLRRTV